MSSSSTEVMKGGRGQQKSSVQTSLNVGVGVLLVFFTYLVISQQFAFKVPYVVITKAQQNTTDQPQIQASGGGRENNGTVVCSSEGRFSESCEISGDVRVNGTSRSVFLVPTNRSERRQWQIRPYSRRTMDGIKKVNVTQLPDQSAAPACTVSYRVPAVLFALGGLTGNIFHDYADVLVPLFAASRRYDGEVQFLVANLGFWPKYITKHKTLLRRLSKYNVVDLDDDEHVRCFRHVTVGIHMHKEFTLVPEREGLTMPNFTRFLREIYALPRQQAFSPSREPHRKPRLMLLRREKYRKFVNEQEILQAAEAAGFEAAAVELRGDDMTIAEQARTVNSFDVLLGIHGAGLTTEIFLPPGGVMIQVVPYGNIELMARVEYDEPATDMGLKNLHYSISLEESTLLETLGPDHPAIKDPDSIHRQGWLPMYETYLIKQDVRLNVTRFTPILAQAMDHLRQH